MAIYGVGRIAPDVCELLLLAMPGTMRELSLRTGLKKTTAKQWTLQLRRYGWAHVSGWNTHGAGKQRPIITAGPGVDVPCPPTTTQAERSRRFRDRARESGEYEFLLRRRSARASAERKRKSGRKATPFDALMR